MKSVLLTVALTVMLCGSTDLAGLAIRANAELTVEEISELAGRYGGDTLIPITNLTEAERKSLSEYSHKKIAVSDSKYERERYETFLVRLGDEWAFEKVVERFAAGDVAIVRELFAESGRPKAVEVLVPLMFKEERYQRLGGDVPHVPISFFAAAAIPMVLGNSPSFSPEVIQWAQAINRPSGGHIEYPEIRAVMRDWWRANEQHFRAKNYKAVQPGREPKVTLPALADEPPSAAPFVTAPPATPLPPAPRIIDPPADADSSWLGLAILGGCLALLATALACLAKRPPH